VDKAVLFIKNSFEYGQAYGENSIYILLILYPQHEIHNFHLIVLYIGLLVALSRVKTIDGLSLSHSLKNCFIKAHPDVKKFYENLKNCRTKDLISE
jgi:hypothetical protein